MNLSNIKMVVTDMDGSLLNEHHEVSARFWQQFKTLKALGIDFVAASGRQYASMRTKLKPIQDDVTFIAENGAVIFHKGKSLATTALSSAAIKKVLSLLDLSNAQLVLCSRDMAYVLGASENLLAIVREFYTQTQSIKSFDDIDAEIVKIAIYHPESSEQYLYPQVKACENELLVKISGTHWLDISDPKANKGSALKCLLDERGIHPDQVLVFGDYHNDIEMLALAHYSVAMANAHPDVKAVANYETLSHRDMGVEHMLDKLIQDKKSKDSLRAR